MPAVVGGRIAVADGDAAPKFLDNVEQRTFSGRYAAAAGKPVLYVTERCVFRLTPDGLELIEIAPGASEAIPSGAERVWAANHNSPRRPAGVLRQ